MNKKFFLLFFFASFNFFYCIDGILIKTSDYSFRDKWDKTLGKTAPRIYDSEHAYKGQKIYLGTVVWQYGSDNKNVSDVIYSIKIISPSGKGYFSKENLQVIKKEIENKNYLQMSDNYIYLTFNSEDEFGKYKIETEIVDRTNNTKKSISSEIELLELPDYKNFKVENDQSLEKWMDKYYINQEPEKALANYIYFVKSKVADDENVFLPTLSFFKEVFSNNQYLFKYLPDAFNNEKDDKTKMLLTLMLYESVDEDVFIKYFPDKEQLKKLKEIGFPDIYGNIENANQLDMLWNTFSASGSQKPILKLIQTLDYSKYKGSLDAYKNSKKSETDKQNAIKDAIYGATTWSLDSHFKTDELVLDYANWILANEKLSDTQKQELSKLLEPYK